jgi:hypothetical protein
LQAQITLTSPAGGLTDPWVWYPGGNLFPSLRKSLKAVATGDG